MKALFFGDSLTSGENNNNASYVDYVNYPGEKVNLGVSGTTFGRYSIYPVGNNSFLDKLYEYQEEIKEADDIFFSFGINDAVSAALGYTSVSTVLIDIVASLDMLRRLNSTANLYFIGLTYEGSKRMAELQSHYLTTDYLSNSLLIRDEAEKAEQIRQVYFGIVNLIMKYPIKCVFAINEFNLMDSQLDEDGLHPNDLGYHVIATDVQNALPLIR